MKKIVLGLMVLSMSLFAGTINVAVAANVSYAMDKLLEEFHKTNPDTQVKVTLGSSGKLTAQIKNGAPYQLFMAANMMFPQSLYEEGIAITVPVVYAQGSLAMLSNSQKDFSKSINLLKDQSIQKIAIANPKTAPYGKAALEAIKNAGVLADVESKFVYAESISQTVSYAVTAADIGFIAKSSLYSPKMTQYKEGVHWVDVDSKLYTPINQGIVIIKNAKDNSDAKAFYDFMLGAQAKKILIDFGYLVP
ncbi:molybdate ABC transporter substrate-binding protein [Sulfurimonas sp.]|uniref:molybdate ABC transporter substrate-binding protein n=1 Tax=Sulfurimonas sp. TaxID=2022749 RepID=UPI0025D4956B|nr:molybdate ABC transporter substrate-binding protein [Sulfurimonas sp.]MBW6488598.1 molybdate ABC transporter substrate-binding protein [Sulfurimonas sp.]